MEKSGGSRLMQMQARFQQRQMAEKEHKLVAMYEAQQTRALTRLTASSVSTALQQETPPSQQRQGKVRQMFEERRSKAGIDKSYPLQPIHGNTDKSAPASTRRVALPNGYSKLGKKPEKKPAKPVATVPLRNMKSQILNTGAGDINDNIQQNVSFSKNLKSNVKPQDYYNGEKTLTSRSGGDRTDGFERHPAAKDSCTIEDETFPEQLAPPFSAGSQPSPPPRLNRTVASEKRSLTVSKPTPRAVHTHAAAAPVSNDNFEGHATSRASPGTEPKASTAAVAGSPRAGGMIKGTKAQTIPGSPQKTAVTSASHKAATASSSAAANSAPGNPCSICGRKFAPDRLQKHEEVCRKTNNAKKRKPYDALKHRLAGTEAEPFIKQIRKLPAPGKSASALNQGKSAKPLNNAWRQKHEDFIRSIRAAKEAQAFVAAGGKLSDLPPPPPSENPDYVQCPHCGRRFNQNAAQRHIPQCASYQFNKTKPVPKKR